MDGKLIESICNDVYMILHEHAERADDNSEQGYTLNEGCCQNHVGTDGTCCLGLTSDSIHGVTTNTTDTQTGTNCCNTCAETGTKLCETSSCSCF